MPDGVPTVLVVDDDATMLETIRLALEDLGCTVEAVSDGASAAEAAVAGEPDLLVLDRMLPDADGVELLARLRAGGVGSPAIIITAHPSVESAVDALGHHVTHYLAKPFAPEELVARITELLGDADGGRTESDFLWEALRERYDFDHVMSRNERLRRSYAAAARVADTNAPVLLEGETGTGKDYLARAIHYMSDRAERHFVAVNCGALPEQLLTSELFGHEKGAFTSATQSKQGLVEVADGGTLLLDEIGEMSMDNQVKLLHFTQDYRFTRLGGTETMQVDVRLICATNRDLQAVVADGRFRQDLYYRLAVVPLPLPPLRERPEDIEPFARFFLEKHVRRHGRGPREISEEALQTLRAEAWPGNLRQLENAIQRGILLADGDTLRPEHLLLDGKGASPQEMPESLEALPDLKTVEERHIRRVWQAVEGSKARASEVLGISPRTLTRRLEEYGIE
ncbi:MAG: sigma-54-dependent transcriptional regulator [Armatimonadota bacterium]